MTPLTPDQARAHLRSQEQRVADVRYARNASVRRLEELRQELAAQEGIVAMLDSELEVQEGWLPDYHRSVAAAEEMAADGLVPTAPTA